MQLQLQFDCCRCCRVPTLTGVKELSIRPGTQPGDQLRMKGLGMPHLSGFGQGDQFVHVNVTLPRSTTRRQRELLIEFQNESRQKAARQQLCQCLLLCSFWLMCACVLMFCLHVTFVACAFVWFRRAISQWAALQVYCACSRNALMALSCAP